VIDRSTIPPTINHTEPHPSCDLDYVPIHSRNMKVDSALINSLGFGGGHTVVIVGKS